MAVMNESAFTYRRFRNGESPNDTDWTSEQVTSGESLRCPTYLLRTPPCQATCPSGHDVRGWLNIVRGLDKPTDKNMSWQEYAFRRMTKANPFPALMGRVCPAPCEGKCNRNNVEDHVGINSIEHYIGNWALEHGLKFAKPAVETGRRVAVVGGGPAGLSAAYQLRLKGHAVTLFESKAKLGGMLQYGLSTHRCPREVVDAEIARILELGIAVRTNTRVGTDVSIADLERDFDAVFWGIGAWKGKPLANPGFKESPNCVDGITFIQAANEGRLKYLAGRVLIIGGGDTAMDCAAVARRLGCAKTVPAGQRPEDVIAGMAVHAETPADLGPSDVVIVYRRPIAMAPAGQEEIACVREEGVEIRDALAPVEVVRGADGRATALRVIATDWSTGKMVEKPGTEQDIECSLIVAATGQGSDFAGIEAIDTSGKGWTEADLVYRVKGRKSHFAGGDMVNPELLTTAIGHGWKAADAIDHYLNGIERDKPPRVQVKTFDLLDQLTRAGLGPSDYDHAQTWGTDGARFAVHNIEDRASSNIVPVEDLFLGYFKTKSRHLRRHRHVDAASIVGDHRERLQALTEEDAVAEADRCMSCGLCLECDTCMIYCPQTAVSRVKSSEKTMGRYVTTDYAKCVGCEICVDVCPTGYIQMGLGE
ncbi:MAG: NAD(P)-binding protein [Magnetospirillum sp. WYHS-4]